MAFLAIPRICQVSKYIVDELRQKVFGFILTVRPLGSKQRDFEAEKNQISYLTT